MVIHQVKLASTLSDEEVRAVMRNRATRLRGTPGLLQTYYEVIQPLHAERGQATRLAI
jgi:hypothetical protein